MKFPIIFFRKLPSITLPFVTDHARKFGENSLKCLLLLPSPFPYHFPITKLKLTLQACKKSNLLEKKF